MRKRKARAGYTLMELIIAVAIMGIVLLGAPELFTRIFQFIRLSIATAEIQKSARSALSNMNRDIRQARASSVTVDQISGQPPYSRITFTKMRDGGSDVLSYFQRGNRLYLSVNGAEGKLAADTLRQVYFSYPRSDDSSIISVSITFEKETYEGGSKALQMAVEKVRIMN